MTEPTDIAVIGVGYIGYPLALLLASTGHRVLAVDVDQGLVDDIAAGTARADEPGVAALASRPDVQTRLRATTVPEHSSVYIIAVPTPLDSTGRRADLSAVHSAALSIVPVLRSGDLVIVESTVPPGTTENLVAGILGKSGLKPGEDFLLAHCPERLHPGSSLKELRENDRIIGGVNEASIAAAREVYETFVTGTLIPTDATTAELCKLFENTYRDVNIALANQMAGIAEQFGVDATEALRIASRHPRVDYLEPGIGVGGHCIPVDPWFLHQASPDSNIVESARIANLRREEITSNRIAEAVHGLDTPVVVIGGAAYKKDVSDTRESPALRICDLLIEQGITVRIYDPLVPRYDGDIVQLASGADLLAITVPHTAVIETISANIDAIRAAMRRAEIADYTSGAARPFTV